jgi:SAM-dependent methyltransferase
MQDRARPAQPRGDASWEEVYAGTQDPLALPWGTERLDADMAAWVDASRLPRGAKALDIGTGPGTAAMHLVRIGFDVTALDISPTAIAQAQQRAGALPIAWVAGDVFRTSFPQPFDLALDRGLFHTFPDELRAPYVERVASWVKPKGYLLLKTFSDAEPPGWGPRRVTRLEVKRAFGAHFSEEAWQPSTFPGHATEVDHEPQAHLFVLRRR